MPSSPILGPDSGANPPVQPWPTGLEIEFEQYLLTGTTNRFVLTTKKRADIQWHLTYPTARTRGANQKERGEDAAVRQWALNHFELQDNQVDRKGEKNQKTREWIPLRYCACT